MDTKKVVLSLKELRTSFKVVDTFYAAVDGVSLDVYEGEFLAIVGESGCGKSALALSVMGLHPDNVKIEGEINYKGENILNYTEEQMQKIRGFDFGMMFQEPLTALNPLMKIGKQIEEGLEIHSDLSKSERHKRVISLLEDVGINEPETMAKRYPHELSGGMRQRIVIAIALANNPSVIIADEPTTALDVTIQSQILDLMNELLTKRKSATILITHDLGVVSEVADRVAVMYAGQIVEVGTADDVFSNPLHPYTKSLLNSLPSNVAEKEDLFVIEGIVPSLNNIDREGCRFAERIPRNVASWHEANPQLREVEPGHFVRCTCYKYFEIDNTKKAGEENA